MNKIFRLVWSQVRSAWVVAPETARGRGKGSSRKLKLELLAALSLPLCAGIAQASPVGGQIGGGAGSITQSGLTTTIHQSSQNLSVDWKSFNVGAQETVDFVQPSTSAIAVNRIFDTSGTQILGHLNANGQVYLINPNGVLFGPGAQVNVGGLVASTLDVNDASLNGNTKTFSGKGKGSVVNRGSINTTKGGYVALLGNTVSNQGSITAPQGTVALGAGSAATLTFENNSLVKMQVDQSLLNSLAENGGVIRADGGQVIMSAGAKDALLASVVNNTGVIEARTVENHEGTITLLGGMAAGTVNVAGTLDASAPTGGNGGFIETSAAHVAIKPSAHITTASAQGKTGDWLIDPTDYTVAATGGDITGTQLSTNLASNNIEIKSSAGTTTASGTGGNINVNQGVTWAANTTLTLTASNNVNVNANINATGALAGIVFNPNTPNGLVASTGTGKLVLARDVTVGLSGANSTLVIGGANYTVIHNLAQLQAVNTNVGDNYALGNAIDASATRAATPTVFTPIADFTGNFNGLGNSVNNLTISSPGNNVALFGGASTTGSLNNIGLVNAHITGNNYVAGLVSHLTLANGDFSNNYSKDGTISGLGYVGGLASWVTLGAGNFSNNYVTGTAGGAGSVTGTSYTGGVVGWTTLTSGNFNNNYATVAVNDGGITASYMGGVVGWATLTKGNLNNNYATGNVQGVSYTGGLAGWTTLTNGDFAINSATGNVTDSNISGSYAGGLVGWSTITKGDFVSNSATGNVTGSTYQGGLVGMSTISNGSFKINYATGNVTATSVDGAYSGGLAGWSSVTGGNVDTNFATGNVMGATYVGGLMGLSTVIGAHSFSNNYATGNVLDSTATHIGTFRGGLVGDNSSANFTNNYATGFTAVGTLANSGGLIGNNAAGNVTSSYWVTSVANPGGAGIASGAVEMTTSHGGTPIALDGSMLTQANFTGATAANSTTTANTTALAPDWKFTSNSAGPNTWVMTDGSTHPFLQAFITPTYVTIASVTKVYDGLEYVPSPLAVVATSGNNGTMTTSANGNVTYFAAANPSATGTASGTFTVNSTLNGANVSNVNVRVYDLTIAGASSSTLLTQLGSSGIITNAATLTVTPKGLTVTGATATTRAYDGTTTVVVTGGLLTGLVGTETLILSGETGTVLNKNAGQNKAVTVSGSTLADGTGVNAGLASNYTVTNETDVTADINQVALTLSSATVANKTYDGTTDASVSGGTLSGLIGQETLGVAVSGAFVDKNAGTNKAVNTTAINLANAGDGVTAGLASNYLVTSSPALTATINKAGLTLSGATVANKTYDGTTTGRVTGGVLAGLVGTETLGVSGSGVFIDKNAGANKAVTATAINLANAGTGATAGLASNYTLASIIPTTAMKADINKAELVLNSATVANKNYDGNTTARVIDGTLTGLIGSETLRVTGAGVFADKNVGTNKPVTATAINLINAGTDATAGLASNYNLASISPTTPMKADIYGAEPLLASTAAATTTQIQAEFTSLNPLDHSQSLLMSPTIGGESNDYLQSVTVVDNKSTRINIGGSGPMLQVVNSGIAVTTNMISTDE